MWLEGRNGGRTETPQSPPVTRSPQPVFVPTKKKGRPKAARLCTACLYTVYLAYHKKHVHSRAVSDFIDFVKSYPGNDLPLSGGEE